MAQILVLTMNAHLELAVRLSAMAEGMECHANTDVPDVDALLVDLDGVQPELADLARQFATRGVPILAVAQEPMHGDFDLPADVRLAKPVESAHLVFVLRQLCLGEYSSDEERDHLKQTHTPPGAASPERS